MYLVVTAGSESGPRELGINRDGTKVIVDQADLMTREEADELAKVHGGNVISEERMWSQDLENDDDDEY